jgi:hypothetical protein
VICEDPQRDPPDQGRSDGATRHARLDRRHPPMPRSRCMATTASCGIPVAVIPQCGRAAHRRHSRPGESIPRLIREARGTPARSRGVQRHGCGSLERRRRGSRSGLGCRTVRSRLKLSGEVGDTVSSCRWLKGPGCRRWMIATVRDPAACRGRWAETRCRSFQSSVWPRPCTSPIPAGKGGGSTCGTNALVQAGMVGNHVADIVTKYGADGVSPGALRTTSPAAKAC